ncbi:MAG: MarR family transcriptional regulator [Eubacterium sp.]|nr:MarR family transcriptional regulator [Eubacterium sp.]
MDSHMIKRIRSFNRYYTVWLEVMNKEYLETDFSWTESRILFEIHISPGINATELCEHFNMDKGYMSRILRKFEKQRILTREQILGSKGLKKIYLTKAGEKIVHQINTNGDRQIADKLKGVDDATCIQLCEAMEFIKKVLSENEKGGMPE